MKEKHFIQDAKKWLLIEEFIRDFLSEAKCSSVEAQETPLGTRITIRVLYPGIAIGSGGENLRIIQEKLEKEFGIRNPQINVERVENPMLDATIVAQLIASAIERGAHYRRVAQYYLRRVMEEGARGCEIRISGKLGSELARTEKFYAGYIAKSGTKEGVDIAYAQAQTKPGTIGIRVAIMKKLAEVVKEVEEKGETEAEGEKKEGEKER